MIDDLIGFGTCFFFISFPEGVWYLKEVVDEDEGDANVGIIEQFRNLIHDSKVSWCCPYKKDSY